MDRIFLRGDFRAVYTKCNEYMNDNGIYIYIYKKLSEKIVFSSDGSFGFGEVWSHDVSSSILFFHLRRLRSVVFHESLKPCAPAWTLLK